MATYEMAAVDVKQIPDDVMREIKSKLKIEGDLPVLALAFKRDGTITVVRAEGEFQDTLSEKPLKNLKLIPGCVMTAEGSFVINVILDGVSLSYIAPPELR